MNKKNIKVGNEIPEPIVKVGEQSCVAVKNKLMLTVGEAGEGHLF
jgi:hypothetical protein